MAGNEFVELIVNSNLTWAAALTLISFALRPVLAALVEGIVEARKQEAAAVHDRNANEREQTKVLSEVRDALADNVKITGAVLNLIQNVASIPKSLDDAKEKMAKRADARDASLALHARSLDQLHQAVASLPETYLMKASGHFDPQFTRVLLAIEELKKEVLNAHEVLTPDVVKDIRGELARIAKLVTELSTVPSPTPRRTRARKTTDGTEKLEEGR